MPRTARNQTLMGYHHVIIRGIGRQVLFEETEDYVFFLKRLKKYATSTNIDVCAYCLMENHVHLLIRDNYGNMPILMHKIGISYAYYFNKKYERVGHLFQDRYKNELITNEAYLLNVYRYVINNPAQAGICTAAEYPWSSYWEYYHGGGVSNREFAEKMFELGNVEQAVQTDVMERKQAELEAESKTVKDTVAINIIREELGGNSGSILQSFDKWHRNEMLRKLKQRGLTIRQISRLTGIGRGVVQRA